MKRVYYNSMPMLSRTVPFLAACVLAGTYVGAQQNGSQQAPLKTTSLETHEGLTISARPWTDAALYKEKFPKKSPYAAGIVAMQVVFRNDSNESLKVGLGRIRLSFQIDQDNWQEVQALTAAQVADEVHVPLEGDDYSTVAGLVMHQLGHVPAAGEKVESHGLIFEVLEANQRTVLKVRMVIPPTELSANATHV